MDEVDKPIELRFDPDITFPEIVSFLAEIIRVAEEEGSFEDLGQLLEARNSSYTTYTAVGKLYQHCLISRQEALSAVQRHLEPSDYKHFVTTVNSSHPLTEWGDEIPPAVVLNLFWKKYNGQVFREHRL